MTQIETQEDALSLLNALGASASLIQHAKIVSEVAAQVLACLDLSVDQIQHSVVLIGAMLHDVGKVKYPEELRQPGHQHELAGQQMLMALSIPEQIAEICVTHAGWQLAKSTEALVVALADKLWKGSRVPDLEDRIIRQLAEIKQQEFWSLYLTVEPCFDQIAEDAPTRLGG